jgi:hypothetical protein
VDLFECIALSKSHERENRPLDGWHRFVTSGDHDLLAALLSEHIVFRSPFVQSPIPGRIATLLVLTTVVQIF